MTEEQQEEYEILSELFFESLKKNAVQTYRKYGMSYQYVNLDLTQRKIRKRLDHLSGRKTWPSDQYPYNQDMRKREEQWLNRNGVRLLTGE
jgi:hypothetical protein